MTSRPSDQPINTSRMLSGEAASCAVAMAAAFTVVCLRAHVCLYTKPSVTWLQPRWNSFSLAGIVFFINSTRDRRGSNSRCESCLAFGGCLQPRERLIRQVTCTRREQSPGNKRDGALLALRDPLPLLRSSAWPTSSDLFD